MLALLAMIMDSMLIFFSKKNVFFLVLAAVLN